MWLLKHTTPSWRAKDPEKGFQRIVKEARAQVRLPITVLDRGRTFPNAITLATNRKGLQGAGDRLMHSTPGRSSSSLTVSTASGRRRIRSVMGIRLHRSSQQDRKRDGASCSLRSMTTSASSVISSLGSRSVGASRGRRVGNHGGGACIRACRFGLTARSMCSST